MTSLTRSWVDNRSQSRLQKIIRWKKNPIGAINRLIEILYFGDPLFLIIKGYGDISEISHLSQVLDKSKDSIDYQYFSEARVSLQSRLVLLDSGHVSAPDHSSHAFLSGNLWAEVRKLKRKSRITTKDKFIPMPTPTYYYHFLIDDIPSLLQTLKMNKEHKILFYGDLPKYVHELFAELDINFEVSPEPVVNVTNMLLPKKKQNYIGEFRDELDTRLNVRQKEREERIKIFIGRKNLPRHDAMLEKELMKFLESIGYQEFIPEELTVREQIEVFASAEAVVALHGGALSNIIFCSSGTEIYEIFNHEYRTYPFSKISKDLDFNYEAIEASSADEIIAQLRKIFSRNG